RVLELAREREKGPLVAAAADELDADGKAGRRARHGDGDRREAEGAGVRAQCELAARAHGLAVDGTEAPSQRRGDVGGHGTQRGAVALEPRVRLLLERQQPGERVDV